MSETTRKIKGKFIDKYPLDETELKIVLLIASKVKEEDDLKKVTYKFDINSLKRTIGLPETDDINDLAKVTANMIAKFFIVQNSKSTLCLKWVYEAYYNLEEKSVTFSILPELKKAYLCLKEKFAENTMAKTAQISQIFS